MPKRISLPPGFYLSAACELTAAQSRELTALSKRWKVGIGQQDRARLYRDLDAWGRKHGLIVDPVPSLPADSVLALREEIRRQRLVLNLLNDQKAYHQNGIDGLWKLFRERFPDRSPPKRPIVETGQQAHDALDLMQRELDRLQGDESTPRPRSEAAEFSDTANAALDVIQSKKGAGLVAKEIVKALERKGIKITEGTFRRHIVPQLKALGVENERARGGYYDTTCLPSM